MSNELIRIGVVGDTHFERLDDGLDFFSGLFAGVFADVDLVLHTGDIVHPDLLTAVTARPILAVRGNCDAAADTLPSQRIVERAGYRLGLIHGWGGTADLEHRVLNAFGHEPLSAVIYGHSHFPVCRRERNLLLVNPGSPTDRRQAPFHSVALLSLGRRLSGQIVNLDTWSRNKN